jgi:hypothetical protein
MISLGRKPAEVPPTQASESVPPGRVFVATKDGETYTGRLQDGKAAVLESGGKSLELTTMSSLRRPATAAGTYLNNGDLLALGARPAAPPKLRKYRVGDTLRKALTPAGAILLAITALGVLGAVASLVVGIAGESPTSAATVSERAQTLISWVTAPADRLEGADGPKVATGRRFIRRREATAQRCLRSLAGGEPSKESPAGVSCEPKDPPWWKNKEEEAKLGLWIALATTFFGLFGVGQKFGFGSKPT